MEGLKAPKSGLIGAGAEEALIGGGSATLLSGDFAPNEKPEAAGGGEDGDLAPNTGAGAEDVADVAPKDPNKGVVEVPKAGAAVDPAPKAGVVVDAVPKAGVVVEAVAAPKPPKTGAVDVVEAGVLVVVAVAPKLPKAGVVDEVAVAPNANPPETGLESEV